MINHVSAIDKNQFLQFWFAVGSDLSCLDANEVMPIKLRSSHPDSWQQSSHSVLTAGISMALLWGGSKVLDINPRTPLFATASLRSPGEYISSVPPKLEKSGNQIISASTILRPVVSSYL